MFSKAVWNDSARDDEGGSIRIEAALLLGVTEGGVMSGVRGFCGFGVTALRVVWPDREDETSCSSSPSALRFSSSGVGGVKGRPGGFETLRVLSDGGICTTGMVAWFATWPLPCGRAWRGVERGRFSDGKGDEASTPTPGISTSEPKFQPRVLYYLSGTIVDQNITCRNQLGDITWREMS